MIITFKTHYNGFVKGQQIELPTDVRPVVLVGESGSGKSTLLKIIHGHLANEHERLNVGMREKMREIASVDTGNESINTLKYSSEVNQRNNEDITIGIDGDLEVHIIANSISRGEATCLLFNRYMERVSEIKNKESWHILEDIGDGLQPIDAYKFGALFNDKSKVIMSVSHPYIIEQLDTVYELVSTGSEENGDRKITVVKTTGSDFLKAQLEKAKKSIKDAAD